MRSYESLLAGSEARLKQVVPAPAKEMARRGFRSYGAATSAHRPPPDFLIIGTKRGGTTSLWWHLLRHPLVLPLFPASENVKSPHYFDIHYDRGFEWYRSHFASQHTRARVKRARGHWPVAGEASPYYMFHPLAAQRVMRDLPSVRVVVMLRNPVDRAMSHYRERVKAGTEQLSFEQAVETEAERTAGEVDRILTDATYYSEPHDVYSYMARGRYLEHLETWLPLMDAGRLLVVRSEDYYQSPQVIFDEVGSFLGLPPNYSPAFAHFNKTSGTDMSAATRARLEEYFRPHVAALENRLGRDFAWFS